MILVTNVKKTLELISTINQYIYIRVRYNEAVEGVSAWGA